MRDPRPPQYMYWDQLIEHLPGGTDDIFKLVRWPQQREIHLPADHEKAYNRLYPRRN